MVRVAGFVQLRVLTHPFFIFTETIRVTLLLRGVGFLDVPSYEGVAGLGVALSGLVREDVVASCVPPVLLEDVTGFSVTPSGLACEGVGNSWVSKGFAESLCTEQWKIMRLRSRAFGKPKRTRPSASVKKKLAADFRPKNSFNCNWSRPNFTLTITFIFRIIQACRIKCINFN